MSRQFLAQVPGQSATPEYEVVALSDLSNLPTTLNAAAQPTFRNLDSEITESYVGSVNISGSIAAVRGAITDAPGSIIASGFQYGTQGKLTCQGTLNNGSGFNAALFGQLDTSAAGFVHTSGYLGALILDAGATSHLASDPLADMID